MSYQDHISQTNALIASYNGTWDGISAESVARMRLQNRFTNGLDIARYTAKIIWPLMMRTPPITRSRSVAGTALSVSKR